jgi:hypothetical protein
MSLRTMAVVAEVASLVVVLIVIRWLQTILLGTNTFWPLIAYSVIYLGVRAAMLARKARSR